VAKRSNIGYLSAARLLDTGGLEKPDRITYRIPITALADIDDEV